VSDRVKVFLNSTCLFDILYIITQKSTKDQKVEVKFDLRCLGSENPATEKRQNMLFFLIAAPLFSLGLYSSREEGRDGVNFTNSVNVC
jgi:hypothetical protein